MEFSTNEKGFQAPLKKNTELGTLTYTDPEPIGQGYLENKAPSVTMVAGQEVEKSIRPLCQREIIKKAANQMIRGCFLCFD